MPRDDRFTVPADALRMNDWVETGNGRIGIVAMHGWDADGHFGYLVNVERVSGAPYVWVWHSHIARIPLEVRRG